MPDAADFQALRPLLFSMAYRMLGSAADAEDVVQDAWIRISHASGDVRSLKAFATTVVSRLCLDRLKSARAARETYVGPWLPEPVLTSPVDGPDALLQRSESVTLAFLVLLETLSPEERAVFLLKEVFDYPHDEIARTLGLTAANARQLLHRARARVAEGRPRFRDRADAGRRLAEEFASALRQGDPARLTAILNEDVGLWSDGGGKASAARRPLLGRDAVLAFLIGLHRIGESTGQSRRASLEPVEVNFEPALLLRIDDVIEGVFVLSGDEGAISGIRVVRNPDKLAYLERQLASRAG